MRIALTILFCLAFLTRAEAATIQGDGYTASRGQVYRQDGFAHMDNGWAYWRLPVEASGEYRARVHATGKYRADTLDPISRQWQPIGEFNGNASFPALSGCVAVTAHGQVTVWSVSVD